MPHSYRSINVSNHSPGGRPPPRPHGWHTARPEWVPGPRPESPVLAASATALSATKGPHRGSCICERWGPPEGSGEGYSHETEVIPKYLLVIGNAVARFDLSQSFPSQFSGQVHLESHRPKVLPGVRHVIMLSPSLTSSNTVFSRSSENTS